MLFFRPKDLEDFVAETMACYIAGQSEIGKLRRKCDIYDENLEKWKKKAQVSDCVLHLLLICTLNSFWICRLSRNSART